MAKYVPPHLRMPVKQMEESITLFSLKNRTLKNPKINYKVKYELLSIENN